MENSNGNGAPYNVELSFPGQQKDTQVYACPDADTVLNTLTTLGLVHIKENLRKANGVRMMFEVVVAPREVENVPSGDVNGADDSRGG